MAIIKRPSKDGMKYQIKLQGSDGRWISETFTTRRVAEQKEEELKRQKHGGTFVSGELRRITLDQYFEVWHRDTEGMKASPSWRESQLQMYRTYVQPIIGSVKLQAVTPAMILRVLQSTKRMGRASPTVRHVYTLLHKVFRDAVEIHEMLDRNPVKRNQKPDLEEREAEFLEVAEAKTLLNHVRGKPYEIPIWLGVFVGLRVGEVQALLWENIDLERGVLHVRRTYVRREKRFKEYPKGRRWHQVAIPTELWEILIQQRQITTSKYVAAGPNPRVRDGRPLLEYGRYLLALKGYLKEAGLKDLATHNLRHSTSGLWMAHGASDQDMRLLFAHSNDKVTQRYIHFQTARQLGKVANIIRLFPDREMVEKNGSSQNLPKSVLEKVDVNEGVC